VLLPGTAFVELAVRAGDEVGCERIEELTLSAPLMLPEHGAVQVQVGVGEAAEDGRRLFTVHGRPENAADEPWTQYATGLLAAGSSAQERAGMTFDVTAWPPAGAEVVDLGDHYERLAELGFDYGPGFQGLRAVWRRGDDLFTEVELPDEVQAGGFGVHPALLDAVLHAVGSAGGNQGEPSVGLPFSWEGVRLHASEATAVRAQLTPTGRGAVAIEMVDAAGDPVVSVEALLVRPVAADDVRVDQVVGRDSLFRVDWTTVADSADGLPSAIAVVDSHADAEAGVAGTLREAGAEVTTYPDLAALAAADGPVPEVVLADPLVDGSANGVAGQVHATVLAALEMVQYWLSEERFAGSRLVAAARGEADGLAVASVWGLLRSAQAEHPDRITLLDGGGQELSASLWPQVLSLAEPEVGVRDGGVVVPRLVRVGVSGSAAAAVWSGPGAMLIT
ncbi:polyketide synthase dehydratase domain-containing protein, partial [Streptomyces coffeae]